MPCARPEAPGVADERGSKRRAEEQLEAYVRAMSDYVSCTRVKHEHAKRTNASPERLSHLAAETTAAADELAEQAARYEERFGPRRIPRACQARLLPVDERVCALNPVAVPGRESRP